MNKTFSHNDLNTLLIALREENDRKMRDQFERSLSFQDSLFDRWDRAKRLNFGENSSIYDSALVYGNVEVGPETWIGPYTILDGTGGLRIGSYCSISAGVHIYTHDTVLWALSGGKEKRKTLPVQIGNNCYIGAQSIIKAGVTIGNCCVIGANTFVNKSINNNQIVIGNPAKEIGRVVVGEDGDIHLEYYDRE